MRSLTARRLAQVVHFASRYEFKAVCALPQAITTHSGQAIGGFTALNRKAWTEDNKRGFASQPTAKDVPMDHEHVNVSNEIDKELLRASEHGGVSALYKVIESHGEDFDESNVATAFHELAKVAKDQELGDVHVHDTFQTLVDMAIMGRRRFNARLLTSIVKSAAELRFDDEALLDKLSQNLLTRMDKLDAIEVTDLATGLADMEHSPSVILFEALQQRANVIANDLTEEQKADMKNAFKKLGYEEYGKKI